DIDLLKAKKPRNLMQSISNIQSPISFLLKPKFSFNTSSVKAIGFGKECLKSNSQTSPWFASKSAVNQSSPIPTTYISNPFSSVIIFPNLKSFGFIVIFLNVYKRSCVYLNVKQHL